MPTIHIEHITPERAELFEAYLRQASGEETVEELNAARAGYDLLASDSFWLLLALVDGKPAGLAAVARVPKTDARVGFLFVDELGVLPEFRRQGVAAALLAHIDGLARRLGLAGVRLLVRPENEAARRVYQQAGFSEQPVIFCQTGH